MPKKFAGENSKAIAARERKAAAKDIEIAKKKKDTEDAYWKDDDKQINKKIQRKEDNNRKKQQILEKKAEAKALLEKEMQSLNQPSKLPAVKITRAQIQSETEKRNAAATAAQAKPNKPKVVEQPLEENVNKLQTEDFATTIDEALALLSTNDDSGDRHPEKRLKAAFLAYQENNLPNLKQENPTLRMSQLKQILFKEWTKSSENPLNLKK